MAISEQKITDRYAVYNGDGLEVLPTLKANSVHLSIYSPPFATDSGGCLYHYSSSDRDLSNCRTYAEFFQNYEFFVREIERVTLPGRMTAVHCMDVPSGNTGCDSYSDFPGDIIRLHERCGFRMASPRIVIWKEPLAVRNRTLTKSLAHKSIVDDSCDCCVAGGDYLLIFRKQGANPIPVTHARGLTRYAGTRKPPADILRYRGWKGNQIENRYSQWVWRQYASCVWDDIRGNTGERNVEGVLKYREARDEEDEKHVHPLQLDVIERVLTLFSNPGETILTPFMGVGSEVYSAVRNGRRGIGVELKPSYFRQALKNLDFAETLKDDSEQHGFEFSADPYDESTPHRSDDWLRLLGHRDSIVEEAYQAVEREAGAK
jgi:DNA modification methylase